jgi:hypothetical protein
VIFCKGQAWFRQVSPSPGCLARAAALPARDVYGIRIAKSEMAYFISGLMESAADFVACDMPHANRLTIHILAAIAEHEREMISVRTKDALKAARARGTKLGNPRWQESIAKARAKRKARAATVGQIVEMMRRYRSERMTLRAIAREINALGLKTPAKKQWYASTVRKAIQLMRALCFRGGDSAAAERTGSFENEGTLAHPSPADRSPSQ